MNSPSPTVKTSDGAPRVEIPKASRQKVRYRFILATPMLTTLLVLGLGFVTIFLIQTELIETKNARMTATDLYNQIALTLNHLTIIVIIASVIAFIAGTVMALTITNPIKRLMLDAESIARGDLSRNIRLRADGELAMLGSAFNEMVSSINEYMLHSMSGGLLTINEKGEITSISGDAEVIIGVSGDHVVGKHITKVFPENPENRRFLSLIQDTLDQKHTFSTQKMEVSTKERHSIPVSVSTYLLRDNDNLLVGLVISFEDVRRLKRIEEQMIKVDRLTTLGGLAASIAHQVRNPLCSIRGLAQLLKENQPENTSINSYSDIILHDVDRIDQVVKRLMRFLQPTNTDWKWEDINGILGDTLILARHEIRGKNIELVEQYGENLPRISAQRENLLHAFLNIVINAIQSIAAENGEIQICSRALMSDCNTPDGEEQPTPGVEIEIIDNGPGIPPDVIDNIFNPSYTTKEHGSGFGLAIVRQTIEAHGGEISVTSDQDAKRTSFKIWLPQRAPAPEEATV